MVILALLTSALSVYFGFKKIQGASGENVKWQTEVNMSLKTISEDVREIKNVQKSSSESILDLRESVTKLEFRVARNEKEIEGLKK